MVVQMYVFFRISEVCSAYFLHIYFFIRKSVYLFLLFYPCVCAIFI